MVFGEEKWCQSFPASALLRLIAIPSDEGILSLEVLKGGVDVDEDHHQQVEHGADNPQYCQNPLLSVVLWLLRDGSTPVMMAMGEHV